MKGQILIFSFLAILCFSCSKEDKAAEKQIRITTKIEPTPEWPNLILGQWEYIESCESSFISDTFTCDSPFSYTYTFKTDAVVSTDRHLDCLEGNYDFKKDKLFIAFECVDLSFTAIVQSITQDELILAFGGDDSVSFRVFRKNTN
ncbi:hypothetical protein [Maribacter sp. 2210JD10-5]|uniref:hypothetical protein n=1 Tax=Maribacter sp. 2210JD10-5 TaxID=3386272 RepID=UPI0039BCE320